MKASSIAFLSIWTPCAALAQSDRDWKLCDAEDADAALAACTRLIEDGKLDPDKRAIAHDNRGVAYWRKRDFARAITDYDEAIRINPQYARAYMRRGAAYSGIREYEKSIADSSKGLELDPGDLKAYVNRSIAYAETGDLDRALADITKAIEIDPNFPSLYGNRGNIYLGKGDYDRAIADYTKIMGFDPKGARAYEYRGNALARKGDYERAIADITKAIELDPKSANLFSQRGDIYLRKGDYERAIPDYARAIGLNPNLAAAYNGRSAASLRTGEYDKAIADATKAIEIDPKFSYAYGNRGSAYAQQQKYEQAIADFSKAIEVDSNFGGSRAGRPDDGMRSGDEQVIAGTSKAIEIDPRLAEAYLIRGAVYERQGEFARAIADYAKYVEINPSHFATRRSLGFVRFLTGDFQGAAPDLDRAFQLMNDPYALLFRYLARKHSDRSAEAGLEDGALVLRNRVWPYAFTQLYLGKRPPEFFLAAALKRTDRCMAHFYIGEWYGLRDKPSEAAAMLNAATEICDKASVEYRAALAELKRLKP
jgi:tetratricopeptide (TPR) repeat protein